MPCRLVAWTKRITYWQFLVYPNLDNFSFGRVLHVTPSFPQGKRFFERICRLENSPDAGEVRRVGRFSESDKRTQRGPKWGDGATKTHRFSPEGKIVENLGNFALPQMLTTGHLGRWCSSSAFSSARKTRTRGLSFGFDFRLKKRRSPSSPRVCPKMAKAQNKGKMVNF